MRASIKVSADRHGFLFTDEADVPANILHDQDGKELPSCEKELIITNFIQNYVANMLKISWKEIQS